MYTLNPCPVALKPCPIAAVVLPFPRPKYTCTSPCSNLLLMINYL
ncbi:MAG: hypothetical protein ACFE96_00025 [Candidatus Hermodarchaeota archaeon]